MKLSLNSVRYRVLLMLSVVISVGMFGQIAVSYYMADQEVDTISDYHMLQIGLAMRRSLLEPTMKVSSGSALTPIDDADNNCFTLEVTQRPLVVKLATSLDDEAQSQAQNQQPAKLPLHEFSYQTTQGKKYRVLTLLTHTKLIKVTQDLATRHHSARELALRTVTPSLLMGPLILLIIWWGISRAMRPLTASQHEIAQRQANDLQALRTDHVPDEILPFIREINVLFTRINHSFAAQQNFVSNAAHELRSPLAALRLQAQSLQRANCQETRDRASARLIAGIDRATRLVERMLMLAREDVRAYETTVISLPQAARLAIGDVLPLVQERGVDIGADLAEDLPEETFHANGNIEAMRILLRNLLENAVKYSASEGVVHLSLRREGNMAVLCVEDNGHGIPPEERPEVFKRFYRMAGQEAHGNGLGLAIVQKIAERYGIDIALEQSAQLGGLSVRLQIPLV
ncbi:ATP-binding protein [Uliginosibacterium gangwonense]|uniref:ATP-binding protein n=1 Tax=Uliginosibacterium gangwonense TaxID=392736 RepID=UPI00037A13D8|nr:ATP-binding protein [Uliginosibacterium gangwonense]